MLPNLWPWQHKFGWMIMATTWHITCLIYYLLKVIMKHVWVHMTCWTWWKDNFQGDLLGSQMTRCSFVTHTVTPAPPVGLICLKYQYNNNNSVDFGVISINTTSFKSEKFVHSSHFLPSSCHRGGKEKQQDNFTLSFFPPVLPLCFGPSILLFVFWLCLS